MARKPRPGDVEGSITLDQADPHVGDTVTFTVTGVEDPPASKKASISVAIFGPGVAWPPVKIPVDGSIVLGAAGLAYAWLDDDDDLTDGFVAATSFTVDP